MNTRLTLLAVVAVVLLGFALRLYRIDAVPLRGDEAFSVTNWARQPLADSLTKTASIEPHPPLTYVLFRAWGLLAGTSEFTMRLLPALFNLPGIPALYAIGKCLGGRRIGLLAAFLWAVHPYEIWHAQDARNYAIWAGLSALSLWLGLHALVRRRPVDWLLYILTATVAIQVYYLELFTQAALALYVVISRWGNWPLVTRWLAAQAFVVGTAMLSFIMLQGQLFAQGGYGGTAGQGLDTPRLLTWFLPTLTFGHTLPAEFVVLLWSPLLFILALALLLVWRRNRNHALLLMLLGFVPLLLIGLVSLKLDVFRPHYILSAAPAYILIFAALVVEIQNKRNVYIIQRFLPLVMVGVWLGVDFISLYNHYFVPDYTKAKNWPALTSYLRTRLEFGDLVIQTAVDAAFGFYYNSPNDEQALPENPQQPVEAIVQTLEDVSARYRSIWLVGQTFPDWPNAGVVEQWMQDHMQRVRSTQIAGLRIEQYMPWSVADDEIESAPLVSFAGTTELVGIQVFTPPEPTGELTILAYWRAVSTSDTPLKLFVHLIGSTNPATGSPLWTQDDQFPQDGRISTAVWSVGDVYRDVYSLPISTVTPGEYTLVIGLYNPETGERLPVNGGDSYTVQSIHLP